MKKFDNIHVKVGTNLIPCTLLSQHCKDYYLVSPRYAINCIRELCEPIHIDRITKDLPLPR